MKKPVKFTVDEWTQIIDALLPVIELFDKLRDK